MKLQSVSKTTRERHDPSRRAFLAQAGIGLGLGATWVLVPGCGGYPAESGVAFHPWRYPNPGDPPELQAVAAAILAASPHNTQPWLFRVTPEAVDVFADVERNLGAMDPLRREMYLGLGCALENLELGSRAGGRASEVTLLPDLDDDAHVATFLLRDAPRPAPDTLEARLHAAIPKRHTNRGLYLTHAAPKELVDDLAALIDDDVVRLTLLTDADAMAQFRRGTIGATKAIIDDRDMSEASHAWYRHSADEIERYRDGTTLDTTGKGASTRFLGKVVARPDPETAGRFWLAATEDAQTTASAFAILSTTVRDDREQQLRCGRVYQRLHLWATTVGLSMQPLNQMAERQDREQELGLDPVATTQLVELSGGSGAQLLFRIGYAWDDAFASPRRPVAWVAS